jgi:hypothetical protein
MVGLFEPVAAAWNVAAIPHDFAFGQITPDHERMMPFVEKAMSLSLLVRAVCCVLFSHSTDSGEGAACLPPSMWG